MHLTFKIILDKRVADKQNTYPVKLRVYNRNEYNDLFLRIKIKKEDWDDVSQLVRSTHPDHELYNTKIEHDKSKAKKLILLNDDPTVHPKDIIAQFAPETRKPSVKSKAQSIIKYGENIAKQLTAAGKVGNAYVYTTAINKLKSYVGNDTLSFEALTYKMLVEFQGSMLAEQIKVNTISVYMRTIRAIFNRAIREGIASVTNYPFTAYRIKNEKTVNRTLTLAEMYSIVKLKLEPDTPIWHWRNYFMLSFCLIGINFSDMLTLNGGSIIDGRAVFRRKKTGKPYSIKLQPKAIEILNYYGAIEDKDKDELLLPFLKQTKNAVKLKTDIWQAIQSCNTHLHNIAKAVEIRKDISTYYARYTWANIARSLGYSKDIIGQALGHSYGNTTTSIYLDDYDNKIIDDANAKVIETVFR